MDSHFLFARPRSGVSWLRYICRELSGLEPVDAHHTDINPGFWSSMTALCNAPQFMKTHWIPPEWHNTAKLICIVRDYKECILRHRYGKEEHTSEELFADLVGEYNAANWSYMGYLDIFDQWTEPKLLIYYENLIQNPIPYIFHIGNFIEATADRIVDFCLEYPYHKQKSLELYSDPKMSGEDVNFHKEQLSPMQRTKWDNILRQYNPDLFDKYLGRYAE